MRRFLSTPWGVLAALAVCGFAGVQALTPVTYLKGGTADRVLTDNGVHAVWSSSVAPSAIPSLDASKIGSGQVSAARGGTGIGSYASGDLLAATGAATLSRVGIGSSGQVLSVSGGAPVWSTLATLPAAGTARRLTYDNGVGWAASSQFANNQIPFWQSGAISGSSALTFDGNLLTVTPASGNQAFVSSTSGGAVLALGQTSLPSASGTRLSGLNFSANTAVAARTGGAIEVWSDAAWTDGFSYPTYFALELTPPGGVTVQKRFVVRSNGDIELNANESLLSTSATGGFTYLPTMSGSPTGSPTSRPGNTPVVADSSNGALWAAFSSGWKVLSGGFVAYSGPSGTFTIPDGITGARVKPNSGATITIILPAASKYAGRTLTIHKSGTSGTAVLSVGGTAFTAVGNYVWLSDGTNWWGPDTADNGL